MYPKGEQQTGLILIGRRMRVLVTFTILVLLLCFGATTSLTAGPFEDGIAAVQAGDYPTAIRLWRPLADQGNNAAQFKLGQIYRDGKGVKQDYAAAVVLFTKAADQGNAQARYNLGLMYFLGQGVTQDYVQAHKWLNLAAARLEAKPREITLGMLDYVAEHMTPTQIAEAQKQAREWMPK